MANISAIASSIISGGAGVLGGLFQRRFEKKEAEKEREWSEAQTARQNAWNYAMWEKQNEYNSPEQQIQRMHDAGLNPLYYGLDGSSAQGLTAAQPLGYERASIAGMDNPIQQGLDAALKNAQISNIQAQTAKTGEETLSEIQKREKLKSEIDVTKQTFENMKKTGVLTEKQIEQMEKALEWTDRLYAADLAQKESSAALTKSQKRQIDEMLDIEKLIKAATFVDFFKKWDEVEARLKKYAADTALTWKDVENYAYVHMSDSFFSIKNFLLGKQEIKDAIKEIKKWADKNGVDLTKPKSIWNELFGEDSHGRGNGYGGMEFYGD